MGAENESKREVGSNQEGPRAALSVGGGAATLLSLGNVLRAKSFPHISQEKTLRFQLI